MDLLAKFIEDLSQIIPHKTLNNLMECCVEIRIFIVEEQQTPLNEHEKERIMMQFFQQAQKFYERGVEPRESILVDFPNLAQLESVYQTNKKKRTTDQAFGNVYFDYLYDIVSTDPSVKSNDWLRKVKAIVDWQKEKLTISYKGRTMNIPLIFTVTKALINAETVEDELEEDGIASQASSLFFACSNIIVTFAFFPY
ncbi:hypothetical protein C1646_667706 [Rhizophagus diaphanus]|nr:hypothetical protein C1646_667706 [Rhizophagus diaphanus] [Rhizophagus sp. MUCL 43196]